MKVITQSFFTEGREKIGEEGIPDALIDEALEESFPASDLMAWTLGLEAGVRGRGLNGHDTPEATRTSRPA
jgi:hypothetical protein